MLNETEILRILRDETGGKYAIQIGKRRFASLEEINHPKAREVILAAVRELVAFAGGYEQVMGQPLPTAEPPDPSPMASVQPTAEEDEGMTPEQAKFLASLKAETEPKGAEVETKASRRRGLFGGRSRQEPEPALPVLNIVQQIDQILQQKVREFPELGGRKVRLSEAVDGGLKIHADGAVYSDVAEVADPIIRMVIKAAIKEWEEGNDRS